MMMMMMMMMMMIIIIIITTIIIIIIMIIIIVYIWIYFTWPLRKQAAYKQATRGSTALSPFRGTRQ